MKLNHFLVALLIGIVIYSCKKDQDTITTHDIKGMVFNNCTDSGMANVPVALRINSGSDFQTSAITLSDNSGNFIFKITAL